MSFLSTNYSNLNNNDYEPLPEGDYELVIEDVQETASKGGSEALHFDLIVRNDLDQALPATNGKYHNRHLWVDEWKRRKTNQYDTDNLMYFLKAAGIPEGVNIDTMEDFFQIMQGRPVRIHVKVENNTYNGKTTQVNRPAPWDWKQTQFPQVQHQWKDNQPVSSNAMPTNGLPFTDTKQPEAPQQAAISDDYPF